MRLALLDHYSRRGTLPFWSRGDGFSAEARILELADSDPAGLVALDHVHARDRFVLDRIVRQLGGDALTRLLRVLTPEHAALILAYMLDLRQIHRVQPLLSLGDAAFGRLLWVLALTYLLRDPGSQFNRKSFVHELLEGMAEAESLDYGDLVETLRRALRVTQKQHSLASSLPAVLGEVLRDLDESPALRREESPLAATTAEADNGFPPPCRGFRRRLPNCGNICCMETPRACQARSRPSSSICCGRMPTACGRSCATRYANRACSAAWSIGSAMRCWSRSWRCWSPPTRP